jgi:hypothetical protein
VKRLESYYYFTGTENDLHPNNFTISSLAELKAPLERKNSKLGRRVLLILDKSTCGHILTILEMIRSLFFFFCLDLDLVSLGFRFFVVFFCLILYCLDLDLIRSLCFFLSFVFFRSSRTAKLEGQEAFYLSHLAMRN